MKSLKLRNLIYGLMGAVFLFFIPRSLLARPVAAITINYDICHPKIPITTLKEEADEGKLVALRKLRLYYGGCSPKTSDLYVKYARLAAKNGGAIDAYEYASAIFQVEGLQRALPLFKSAVEAGSINASNWLGDAYSGGGLGLPINVNTSIKWYTISAKQGNVYAINELVRILGKQQNNDKGRLIERMAWIEVFKDLPPDHSTYNPQEYAVLLKSISKVEAGLRDKMSKSERLKAQIKKNNFLSVINENRCNIKSYLRAN